MRSLPLVIVFGATGGVGSMLIRKLAARPDLTVVTCGRAPYAGGIKHYGWSFGAIPPIQQIMSDNPSPHSVTVVYAAIDWPRNDEAIQVNLAALSSVIAALPPNVRLVSLSSFVAGTPAQTLYAELKRRVEAVCRAHGGINLRLGLIDSEIPIGQTLLFLKLARLFHVVPVPFSRNRVVLSAEDHIIDVARGLIWRSSGTAENVVEVRSESMTFINAVRHIVRKHGEKALCLPVPDWMSEAPLQICRWIAPRSWLSERLQGLQGFSEA